MKRIVMMALTAAALVPVAHAGEPQRPEFGLSDSVVVNERAPEARRKLDQQAQSRAARESELSAQAYVDSQERIAETFRRPIPDRIAEQTRGER